MPEGNQGWDDSGWDDEAARVAHRRRALHLPVAPAARTRVALALSGGGQRGAAFCLGVMQALAESPCPPSSPSTDSEIPPATPPGQSLLARVDYLSTVGSGSFIGAFFASLFVPGRLVPGSTPRQAAESAYGTLQSGANAPAGRCAMAWLRESGRALTWADAGDGLLAAIVVVRNWLAMQCILGSILLAVLALLALGLHLMIGAWPGVGRDEMTLLYAARRAFNENLPAVWWSEYLWLPIASALLLAVPPAMACGLLSPRTDDAGQPAHALTRPVLLTGIASALVLMETFKTAILIWLVVAAGLVVLLPAPRTVAMYRARAVRALRAAATLTAGLAALGVADTIARSWYLYGSMAAHPWIGAGPALAAVALAWVVHYGAIRRDPVPRASAATTWTWRRFPAPSLAALLTGAAAATLALLLVALWSWIVLWVRWDGGEPVDWLVYGKAWTTSSLVGLALIALAIAIGVGRGVGLVNLSTLQPLHAARLTRAYLGASNGQRHAAIDAASRTAPAPDDALALDAYYDPRTLAPLHLINVTLNESIDLAGQRIPHGLRDRPLCVGPGSPLASLAASGLAPAGHHVRITVDGKPCHGALGQPDGMPGGAQLRTVGDWIALSGGAVPIGPGNAATPGASLLVGLANLRPGIWWQGRMTAHGASDQPHPGRFGRLFRAQYHLACELLGRFHGMRGGWQYLSDGGHFDNTAVYELLRPERLVGLIVLCDGGGGMGCGVGGGVGGGGGGDTAGGGGGGNRFADLSNLVARARGDLGLRIEVDTAAACDPVLGTAFCAPDDLSGNAPADAGDKFAILLNVYEAGQAGPPRARIIVIRPCLAASTPDAARQYDARHPTSPPGNQTEAFLGEMRWENHRALGRALGLRIATGPIGARLFARVP